MKFFFFLIAMIMISCSPIESEENKYDGLKAIVKTEYPWVALGTNYNCVVYFNRKISHKIIIDTSKSVGFQFKIKAEEIHISKKCNVEGPEKLDFKVYFTNAGKMIDSLAIKDEFIVARRPWTLRNSTDGSVLTLSKKNELLFSVSGISNRNLKLETDNGIIDFQDDVMPTYHITPDKIGTCTLTIYDISSGESKYLFEREFTVIKN